MIKNVAALKIALKKYYNPTILISLCSVTNNIKCAEKHHL